MKSQARVVIVGGGIMGVGLAYHLALEGWTDVVLVEKGELTSGSTWHAAGQCPHFIGSLALAKVHAYGTALYPELEARTGQAVSWHRCGGLRLALTGDEVDWFRRVEGIARLAGTRCEIIGPGEIRQHHPFLDVFGVRAAFRTIDDGHVAPADVTMAMAAGARHLGIEINRRTRVTGIARRKGGEWCVATERGEIVCEHVVNAAGSYAGVVGAWTGHDVPIANLLHHYVVTEALAELGAPELPVVRDPWSHCYLRQEGNGLLIGPYETEGAHVCWDGGAPAWDFESELVAPELDRLTPWLARAAERLPLFGQAGVKSVVSGAITHTPDGVYLSGPAHGPPNYWMHCGASIGICQGAGAGKYLAQRMVHGQAEIDLREFDPRRFGGWATRAAVAEAAVVDYHHMYRCLRPGEQHPVARDLRVSPIHDRLAAAGAQFAQVAGWERPRWFSRGGAVEAYSFRRSNWWDPVRAEALAVRRGVGLADLSGLARFEVTGADAAAFLDRICAARIPERPGRVVRAPLRDANGHRLSELTVTCLRPGSFLLLAAAAAQLHDFDLLMSRRHENEEVAIADVTGAQATLALTGPLSRDVLARCTGAELSNAAFPWRSAREIEVGGVPLLALRLSCAGELGWELHGPPDGMGRVFDTVMTAGTADGLQLFGSYAMDSLRMEKGRPAWSSELGTPGTQLVMLAVEDGDADCLGSEPVYDAEGPVGVTTSGAFGHAVETSLAFATVTPHCAGELEVLVLGVRRRARVLAAAPWDPTNSRQKV